MKHNYAVFTLLLAVALLFGYTATQASKQKRIIISGDYVHKNTQIIFPESFDSYTRDDITSFTKDCSDIGVSYYFDTSKKDPHFTVYIYRAPLAMEYRLRNEFFTCLHAITDAAYPEIQANPKPHRISKDGYSVVGLSAMVSENNLKTVLVLFECGKYFIKYRISSHNVDTSELNAISCKLIDRFSPIDILKKHPLMLGADIHVSPGVTTDTACLLATLVYAKTKQEWVYFNVDSLEECSGYPSLYFEEQQLPIVEMLKKWESMKHNNTRYDKYFNDLLVIRDSGFLNEFIYDQFLGTLLLPKGLTLDLEKYGEWKKINNPTVSITGPAYYTVIGYEASYEKKK